MNLISLAYLGFLVVCIAIYYILPLKIRWVWLLITSLFFYLQSDPVYVLFLLFSITTTYLFGRLLERLTNRKNRKKALILVIILNLGLLFILKFFPFGISCINLIFSYFNIYVNFGLPQFFIPLGISFYTLQAVGYCVDVYRNKCKPSANIFKYCLFISFFPHIIQGPIARYNELESQLIEGHRLSCKNLKFGIQLMLFGFFKKMVIADRLAILVNQVFGAIPEYSGSQLFVAAVFYSLQIYTDFSGCVDICRGTAQTLGINLTENFNHPYFSRSIAEFWRRWHISLSSWLRDYVYIPLGGNRKGIIRKYINVMTVFLVSGLWHGVGFHFLVWGFIHGLYQVVGHFVMPLKSIVIRHLHIRSNTFSYRLGQRIVNFFLVTVAWIFFRVGLLDSIRIITSIFVNFDWGQILTSDIFSLGLSAAQWFVVFISLSTLLIVSLLQEKFSVRMAIERQCLWFRWTIYLLAIFAILVLGVYGPGYSSQQFIYMQF